MVQVNIKEKLQLSTWSKVIVYLPLLWQHRWEPQHSMCVPASHHSYPYHHSRYHFLEQILTIRDNKSKEKLSSDVLKYWELNITIELIASTTVDTPAHLLPSSPVLQSFCLSVMSGYQDGVMILKSKVLSNSPVMGCHQPSQSGYEPSCPGPWLPGWLSPPSPHTGGLCFCTHPHWRGKIGQTGQCWLWAIILDIHVRNLTS